MNKNSIVIGWKFPQTCSDWDEFVGPIKAVTKHLQLFADIVICLAILANEFFFVQGLRCIHA